MQRIAYVNLLKLDSALMDFDKFLKLDSTDSDIFYNRAVCYKSLGNFHEAINNFNHALQYTNRTDMVSIVQLSECKYLLGDTLGALQLLCQTHDSVNWLSDEGYLLRGLIYISYAKYDSAIADLNKYMRFNKTDKTALMYRGKAYYDKHDYTNALLDFYAVINMDSTDFNAIYARGLVYVKLNKTDLARSDFMLADSLGHPYAKKALKILVEDTSPPNVKTE